MEEIKVVSITKDKAEHFASIIPDNIITLLKKGKPVTAFAAITENQVIGALSGAVEGGDFRIDSIYVVPGFRRKGVGTALMNSLKEILEDEDYLIIAEYTAVTDEDLILWPFFTSCFFEEDMDFSPYYCKSKLKDFRVRIKNSGILHEDIKALSRLSEDDIKRAWNSGLDVTMDFLTSKSLDRDASFVVLDRGIISSGCLVENIQEDMIRIHSVEAGTVDVEKLLKHLAYTEVDLKEKYSEDTEIIFLVGNPDFEKFAEYIFKGYEIISHRFTFY